MGKTGLAAATARTPIFEELCCFTFYAVPHIALSRKGETSKIYRVKSARLWPENE